MLLSRAISMCSEVAGSMLGVKGSFIGASRGSLSEVLRLNQCGSLPLFSSVWAHKPIVRHILLSQGCVPGT